MSYYSGGADNSVGYACYNRLPLVGKLFRFQKQKCRNRYLNFDITRWKLDNPTLEFDAWQMQKPSKYVHRSSIDGQFGDYGVVLSCQYYSSNCVGRSRLYDTKLRILLFQISEEKLIGVNEVECTGMRAAYASIIGKSKRPEVNEIYNSNSWLLYVNC